VADFTLHAPRSLAEVSATLGQYEGEARVIAGGTALVLMLRQGLLRPPALVRLDTVPGLDSVRVESSVAPEFARPSGLGGDEPQASRR
jgi:CO/xanthine dehydrogenase FAD-binding subunit